MKQFLFVAIACLFALNGKANTDSLNLSRYLSVLEKNNKAMLSTCVRKGGILEYNQAIGYADLAHAKKNNVYTLFRIGSITKMFTAVMIFQLIEEGKLKQDEKLSTFFPSIPNATKITISNLLNHRSGIFSFTDDEAYLSKLSKAHTEAELISWIQSFKPAFEPDSKADYSNSNYVLLGLIVEKLSKSSYEKELLKRICSKANLSDTKVGRNIVAANNEAMSYSVGTKGWEPETETHPSIPLGAGIIVSTSLDLCKFIEALFEGKLIKQESLEEMKKITDGYGKGMFSFPFDDKTFYGHNGGIDGFSSTLGYNPDDKTAFCILSNGLDIDMNDIAIAVLSATYQQRIQIPSFETKALSSEAMKSLSGEYANSQIGMKINITKEGEQYFAQATGQEKFPLEKVSEVEYKFDAAGVKILFNKESNGDVPSFTLYQAKNKLVFKK